MAPPSKLAVATSSLTRLVKEEASYHKEMAEQEARIKKIQESTGDENAEYQLKQERQGLEETKKVIPSMHEKISQAIQKLEDEMQSNTDNGGEAPAVEVTKAEDALASAKQALVEVS
ncbi:tubulin binding cofactor A-domain-containing protein [Clohesyomyces aquaticus]|uniref:Tubulin-specific chaperone A n=1 Tax=Clohesyomyces aquaticus TaxID=1231657 RepID=A0A1Y2A0D7_9PLEO|nr:tubulin binding cofactor A-domain-containing protein [Clohesyomyces aquaticus]